jgi:TPR repeat protein
MATTHQYPCAMDGQCDAMLRLAQENLGILYCNGWGVAKSLSEAKRLFELAGNTETGTAKYYLEYFSMMCH